MKMDDRYLQLAMAAAREAGRIQMLHFGHSHPVEYKQEFNPVTEVDRLCDEAGKELDFHKRKKLYHRVQEILADELPVIYTADIEMFTLSNKEFEGIPTDVWGMLNPLDTVFWRKGKVGRSSAMP